MSDAGFTVIRGLPSGDAGIHRLNPVDGNQCRPFGTYHGVKSNKETAIVPRQTGTWWTI